MSHKESNVLKQLSAVLILLAAASRMTGCGLLPQGQERLTETTASVTHTMTGEAGAWVKLGDMTDYPEMRSILNAYASPEDTLFTAMQKPEFRAALREKHLICSYELRYIDVAACNAYEAVVDAYFHLTDTSGRYFGGEELLTRAQAMALVTRATQQVPEGAPAQEQQQAFLEQFGKSPYAEQAFYQAEHAYVGPENGLDEASFNAPMTRIEFLYLVVKATGVRAEPDRPSSFNSVKADAASEVNGLEAIRRFEQGGEAGVPGELYEALCTAYSRDEGHRTVMTRLDYAAPLTKSDAIAFIAAVACGREPVPTTEVTTRATTTTTRVTATTAVTTAAQTTAAAATILPTTVPTTAKPVHTTAATTTAVQPQTKALTNPPEQTKALPLTQPPQTDPPQTEPPATEPPATEPQTEAPAPADTHEPAADAQ